ncbi:uncharacterized protein LOC102717299 [Oryza brachyantha]|uniref:Neprosin activation peptide domain-containing protein n=1 Tax=Oryza brachyantha TaxID=4533 RepID=J3NB37_ORYBR|nr:uncharacterized protein LOC102717299 [Oryza brachyantha]
MSSLHALHFALFAVVSQLLATTRTVHGIRVDPSDIIETIQSECGDIIDCVDMYKQPSLKNPLLRDHKIQLKPSMGPPKIVEKMMAMRRNNSHMIAAEQTWQRSDSCPEGSIPVRRTPANAGATVANQTLAFFSSYGRPPPPTNITTIQDEAGKQSNYNLEIAAAYGVSGPYHGASAWIPIWKTAVEPSEFSKSYLLIASPSVRDFVSIRGKDPPNTDNQVAVRIVVYPKYFGDDFPPL